MASSLLRQLHKDMQFYRQLKRPGAAARGIAMVTTAFGSKGWWFLASHRVAHYSSFNRNLLSPRWWLARVLESFGRYLCAVLCRSEAMEDCEITGPVFFSDGGYFMIGAKRIGEGTLLHRRITLGMAVAHGKQDRPKIGRNVWIGPDCVIAGGLTIGDGATIMPGSYVTFSLPPGAVARGNPARIIRHGFNNELLRQSLAIVTELPTAGTEPHK